MEILSQSSECSSEEMDEFEYQNISDQIQKRSRTNRRISQNLRLLEERLQRKNQERLSMLFLMEQIDVSVIQEENEERQAARKLVNKMIQQEQENIIQKSSTSNNENEVDEKRNQYKKKLKLELD